MCQMVICAMMKSKSQRVGKIGKQMDCSFVYWKGFAKIIFEQKSEGCWLQEK